MAQPLMALRIENPQINALGSFQEGARNALGLQERQTQIDGEKQRQALEAAQFIGSMAMGTLHGDRRNPPDPQRWEEALDYLSGLGLKVEQYRGRHDLAPMIARGSISAIDQIRLAQTDQEIDLAMRQFDHEIAQLAAEDARGPKTSLNPIYGTDDQGNTILLQTTDEGTAVRTQLPEGANVSTGVDRTDLGTSWLLTDKRSGESIGTVPKDVAGEQREQAIGKAEGERVATAPAEIRRARQTVEQVDALLNDPGLAQIAGRFDQFRPTVMMGDAGREALTRFNQLKGGAFLEAYQMLKGGGQITEIEGQKAEQAMARMDRSLGDEDFRQALRDFRDAVMEGARKLEGHVNRQGGAQSNPSGTPTITSQEDFDALPSGSEFIWNGQRGRKR